jgi:hypothetical protein
MFRGVYYYITSDQLRKLLREEFSLNPAGIWARSGLGPFS